MGCAQPFLMANSVNLFYQLIILSLDSWTFHISMQSYSDIQFSIGKLMECGAICPYNINLILLSRPGYSRQDVVATYKKMIHKLSRQFPAKWIHIGGLTLMTYIHLYRMLMIKMKS